MVRLKTAILFELALMPINRLAASQSRWSSTTSKIDCECKVYQLLSKRNKDITGVGQRYREIRMHKRLGTLKICHDEIIIEKITRFLSNQNPCHSSKSLEFISYRPYYIQNREPTVNKTARFINIYRFCKNYLCETQSVCPGNLSRTEMDRNFFTYLSFTGLLPPPLSFLPTRKE